MTTDTSTDGPAMGHLRILATSDLHAELMGYDYVADRPVKGRGLASLAPLIRAARAEARAAGGAEILIDNGDLLQGNALGSWLAAQPVDADHLMLRMLDALQFDAVGLGNHDFDFGLPYLCEIALNSRVPWLASTISIPEDLPFAKSLLLTRELRLSNGKTQSIKIGLVSLLPQETGLWTHHHLQSDASFADPVLALPAQVQALRAQGADLVVALAHLGIGAAVGAATADDAALSVAQLARVDAIVAGHTHRQFPGPDHAGIVGADTTAATLFDTPAVMPGHAGSSIGLIDLELEYCPRDGWRIRDHNVTLRTPDPAGVADPAIVRLANEEHTRARHALAEPVGHTDHPLHSYFARVQPDSATALAATANARQVQQMLDGTEHSNLPLLSAAAPSAAGGRGGPDNYIDIPAGTLRKRHIEGICPYSNLVWAVRTSGAQLKTWLEQGAIAFRQIDPQAPTEALIDATIAGFYHDSIFGLTYEIDPTQPPGARVSRLCHKGQPIDPTAEFIVATNQFRVAGSRGFQPFSEDQIVLRSEMSIQEALTRHLESHGPDIWQDMSPWRLRSAFPAKAILETCPLARDHMTDLKLPARLLGKQTKAGFMQIEITLS